MQMFIDRWTEIRGNFAISLGMGTMLQVGQEVIRDRTKILTAAKKMKSSCVCAHACVPSCVCVCVHVCSGPGV